MKFIFSIVFIPVLLMACHNPKSISDSDHLINETTITGTLTEKLRYCGGAKPTQTILDKLKIPKPLNGFKLFIKTDVQNHQTLLPIDSTTTDKFGMFRFKLPKGNYILLSELQLNQAKFEEQLNDYKLKVTDHQQLDMFFQNGLAKFTVSDQLNDTLTVTIHQKCNIPEGILGVTSTQPARP